MRDLAAVTPRPPIYVRHVRGRILGRDYRKGGCRIPDAFKQLAEGAGHEPAWQVVLQDRDRNRAEAARLSGDTTGGSLFAFIGGCGRLRAPVVERLQI